MRLNLVRLLSLAGILVFHAGPLAAQEPPPTVAELILKPGDKITWTVNSPHRVRFGGAVVHGGAPFVLTSFSEIEKLFDFQPALTAGPDGVALGPTGQNVKVTATVKNSAVAGTTFAFTCGFAPHNNSMLTVPFKIAAPDGQPVRQLEIRSEMPPRWLLKAAAGDKKLSLP